MTTLAIQVTTNGEVKELDSIELPVLQESVGGYVQAISLREDVVMWLNEEAKIERLPHNPVGQTLWNGAYGADTDYIQGNAVFTGGTDEHGETLPLSEERAREIRSVVLEHFIRA
jgi:hypothetical protein